MYCYGPARTLIPYSHVDQARETGHDISREHTSSGVDHRARMCPNLFCTVHVASNGSLTRRRVSRKLLAPPSSI